MPFEALIRTGAPVCGLRPRLAARSRPLKVPKPVIRTVSPLRTADVIACSERLQCLLRLSLRQSDKVTDLTDEFCSVQFRLLASCPTLPQYKVISRRKSSILPAWAM